jgi:hypothetical protein
MTDWIDKAINFLGAVAEALPWIGLVAGILIVLAFLTSLILRLLNMRHLTNQEAVLLEVTPPAHADHPLEAARKLLAVLHGLEQGRTLQEKLLLRHMVFAAEVVGTLEEGIRLIVRVPKITAPVFERALTSHSSDAKIRRIKDYLPVVDHRQARMLDFKQTGRSYAYPLQAVRSLAEYDPMAHLMGAMTNLAAGLFEFAERDVIAIRRGRANFFLELAFGRRERIFSRLVLALGDRPSAGVFFGPKRPAGMHE